MITLMTPLHLAAIFCPGREAVVADGQRLSYRTFYRQSHRLTCWLLAEYHLQPGQTVGVLCRTHLLVVHLLPALSRLGVNVRFINTDIPAQQLVSLLDDRYSLLVYDAELQARCLPAQVPCPTVRSEVLNACLTRETEASVRLPLFPKIASLSVFTGGSGGRYKEVSRTTGAWQFLPPFYALLRDVGIHRHKSVLISLPFYHGFGLATFIVSMLLGKKICLLPKFDEQRALQIIREEQVEVLPVVPAMLSRIWQLPEAKASLSSLRCVLSGGDRLSLKLARQTLDGLGPILYNLFGTSEAGFFLLAKPQELTSEGVIGRPICGVRCDLRDIDSNGVGALWVQSGWAMAGQQNRWQCTGDLVSRNENGCFCYHGRADRMVVCGGENVSLDHVEQVLLSHPSVANARAYPVSHPDFGQVINAQIEPIAGVGSLPEEELHLWLSSRLSRAEVPHRVTFGSLEILSTGKRRS